MNENIICIIPRGGITNRILEIWKTELSKRIVKLKLLTVYSPAAKVLVLDKECVSYESILQWARTNSISEGIQFQLVTQDWCHAIIKGIVTFEETMAMCPHLYRHPLYLTSLNNLEETHNNPIVGIESPSSSSSFIETDNKNFESEEEIEEIEDVRKVFKAMPLPPPHKIGLLERIAVDIECLFNFSDENNNVFSEEAIAGVVRLNNILNHLHKRCDIYLLIRSNEHFISKWNDLLHRENIQHVVPAARWIVYTESDNVRDIISTYELKWHIQSPIHRCNDAHSILLDSDNTMSLSMALGERNEFDILLYNQTTNKSIETQVQCSINCPTILFASCNNNMSNTIRNTIEKLKDYHLYSMHDSKTNDNNTPPSGTPNGTNSSSNGNSNTHVNDCNSSVSSDDTDNWTTIKTKYHEKSTSTENTVVSKNKQYPNKHVHLQSNGKPSNSNSTSDGNSNSNGYIVFNSQKRHANSSGSNNENSTYNCVILSNWNEILKEFYTLSYDSSYNKGDVISTVVSSTVANEIDTNGLYHNLHVEEMKKHSHQSFIISISIPAIGKSTTFQSLCSSLGGIYINQDECGDNHKFQAKITFFTGNPYIRYVFIDKCHQTQQHCIATVQTIHNKLNTTRKSENNNKSEEIFFDVNGGIAVKETKKMKPIMKYNILFIQFVHPLDVLTYLQFNMNKSRYLVNNNSNNSTADREIMTPLLMERYQQVCHAIKAEFGLNTTHSPLFTKVQEQMLLRNSNPLYFTSQTAIKRLKQRGQDHINLQFNPLSISIINKFQSTFEYPLQYSHHPCKYECNVLEVEEGYRTISGGANIDKLSSSINVDSALELQTQNEKEHYRMKCCGTSTTNKKNQETTDIATIALRQSCYAWVDITLPAEKVALQCWDVIQMHC